MRLMWLHPQGLEFQFDLERWHRHRRFRRNVHCSLLVRAVCTSTLACCCNSKTKAALNKRPHWILCQKKHRETTAVPVQVGLPHLGRLFHLMDTLDDSLWGQLSVFSFPYVGLCGHNSPLLFWFWNYRKVIWWCVTWASIDNNAGTEMGETSQKAECFVCHIHTELFFLFKWVKHNNRNTLVFRLNVTLFTELWAISFHCFRLSLNMSLTFANNKNVCIV